MPDDRHPFAPPTDPSPFAHLMGWVDHPARHAVAATLPTLAQAGPDLEFDPNKTVLLYKCWSEVFAGYPDYPAQQIGDCVSFGHGHANDLLMTIEAYLGDLEIDSIRRTCTEFLYGESRKVGNMLGRFDGSYGAAAVKAMTTVGMVSYGELEEANLPLVYSGSRAKQWGRVGPPDVVESMAGRHKLAGAALLRTVEDLGAAIQNGKPCTICTGYGFNTPRDQQGFCRMRGRWGHCMFVAGYRADRPGYLVIQSWGPDQPQGPLDLDQPSFSFWVEPDDMLRIIDEGDSFALAGSPGFGKVSLPGVLTPNI